MEKLIIKGGNQLNGTIKVSGSKNAALPILLSSILIDSNLTTTNVPLLRDINTTTKLLNTLGVESNISTSNNSVSTIVKNLQPEAPYDLVKTMRASILVLGPLLARLGKARVALPGGCAIGARPVEQHTKALEKMGVKFDLKDGYIVGNCKKLHGADITFDFVTVGGTEHLMMAASLAKGETILRNAAKEPEIVDLGNFLISCGAKIKGHGTDTIHIEGVESLKGSEYSVMPDRIEAGTFLVAAAITSGNCLIENCPVEELSAVISKLKDMGVKLEVKPNGILVNSSKSITSSDIITMPHPGFPTDMQAQLMALMTVAQGSSTIEETIFENRFMHVPELIRMGADIKLSGSQAIVRGVKHLTGAPVMASDLRASASLVIAGLVAKGDTHVQRIYHLDRGYEKIEEKLRKVGADIIRVQDES